MKIFNNEQLNIVSPSITGENILSVKELTFNMSEGQELSLVKNTPEIISGYTKTLRNLDTPLQDISLNTISNNKEVDNIYIESDLIIKFDLLFINMFNNLNCMDIKDSLACKLKQIKSIEQFIISDKDLIVCFTKHNKILKTRLNNLNLLDKRLVNYTFKLLEEHII